jgi:diguanylate cyclase (GGDEF)-like protein
MRILIAEDQIHVGHLLEELLRPWGYEAVIVPDGLAALGALQSPDAPQLALLDWAMPGLDGIEVCRQIRQDTDRPYTYVILITGEGSKREMLDGLEAGADEYLIKPVDAEELRARLTAGRRIVDLQNRLLTAQRQLREQATRDALTGLWNRRAILEILERELSRSSREGRPVGVILADLDYFKAINDEHGHLAGDRVLAETGKRMVAALRPYDGIGRFGGEEFLMVLPGCDAGVTRILAERLRRRVAGRSVEVDGKELAVTLSLGVSAWESGRLDNVAGLLRVADEALYRAKADGRNRVRAGVLETLPQA